MFYSYQNQSVKQKKTNKKMKLEINLEDNCLGDSPNTPAVDELTPAAIISSSSLENEDSNFNEDSG